MPDDHDGLTVTPLDRAVRRAALYRTERQLSKLYGRQLQKLRAEVRNTKIAHYIEALLEFGVTEPTGNGPRTIENLQDAIWEAAEKFGVSESTAWTAWRRSATYLNDHRRAGLGATFLLGGVLPVCSRFARFQLVLDTLDSLLAAAADIDFSDPRTQQNVAKP